MLSLCLCAMLLFYFHIDMTINFYDDDYNSVSVVVPRRRYAVTFTALQSIVVSYRIVFHLP